MATLKEIVTFLDEILQINIISKDHSNNGLQVEGKQDIGKIAFAVDSSVTLAKKAIQTDADMVFVHHGISWGDNLKYLTNYQAKLVKPLIKNDISLYAAHLPLDAHPEFGHNALIADMIKLKNKKMFAEYGNTEIGVIGDLPEPMHIDKFIKLINNELDEIICAYAHLAERDKSQTTTLINNKIIHRVGVVSGGGADTAGECIDEGADCLLTGEFGHTSYHYAKENNLSIIAPGHYRTEVPGVVAVMDIIKQNFDIETEFIHIPTEL